MQVSTTFSLLITISFFSDVSAMYLKTTEAIDKEDQIVYQKYIEMDKNIKMFVNYGIKASLPYVMEANEHFHLSSNCTRNLFTLISEIKKLKLSALKMMDASGKLPAGLITGTLNMFGDYDECLSTKVLGADGSTAFHGQYCMLHLNAALPKKKRKLTINSGFEEVLEYTRNTSEGMQFLLKKLPYSYDGSLKYGLCVPTGCSVADISMVLNYIAEKTFMNASVLYCDQQYEFHMHSGVIVAISFFSIAGLLAVAGSSLDYYSRNKEGSFKSSLERFLMCFSLLTNFPKVISTKTQDVKLTSIYGIRTLSLFFIVVLHQHLCFVTFEIEGHAFDYENRIPHFFTQVILNGFITTEVFFFLGGLLNTYSRMKDQENGKLQINALQKIIHRLWRIYPTYIFSLLAFFLLKNAYGPLGTFMRKKFIEPCEEKWWQNLLFINNFFEQDKTCMIHSWYVAADTQLFLLSLITVPLLLKNTKTGLILHIVMIIIGLIATMLWAWHKDLMPSVILYILDKDAGKKIQNAYVTTLPHIAPYYTGLIAGYVLSKRNQFQISKLYRFLGWPLSAACFLSMLFMTQKWNAGADFTRIESALYFAFCRLLYVLAVTWVVMCCATGHGGIVNYILSLKIWIPLARISYMVYMISLPLQMHYFGTLKMSLDEDLMTMIWRHIGDLGVSCLLGLTMVVIVESPFIAMEKLMFHKSTRKDLTENLEKSVIQGEILKEIELKNDEKM